MLKCLNMRLKSVVCTSVLMFEVFTIVLGILKKRPVALSFK